LEAAEALGALRDPALRLAFDVEQPLALLRSRRHQVARALQGEGRQSVSRAARQLLEEFGRRVPGLADASAGYLRSNVLSLSALLAHRGDQCTVRLGRPPLDILLVLAGAKRGRIVLPGGVSLELREDTAA
jgi:hypothetical protein